MLNKIGRLFGKKPEVSFESSKVIFIVKKRNDLALSYTYNATGLHTSSEMAVNALRRIGVDAELFEAIDGNSIDKIIHDTNADNIVLEALWLTPSKLKELITLRPNVKWSVIIHSDIPFLAHEGIY
ncbi:MAG: hypothetical protein M0R17_04025 [Candidatus Omnitrophica bacterium]|nr:hypothetical protein [Candidatus Omnitrophota bacterium]